MKNILCFGDSNTWALDAENNFRFSFEERWTGLLTEALKDIAHVYEAGIPDMTFTSDCPGLPDRNGLKVINSFVTAAMPIDLAVIVLGTNDTKTFYDYSPQKIGEEAEKLMRGILSHEWAQPSGVKILLVSPVHMEKRAAEALKEEMSIKSVTISKQLAPNLKKSAKNLNQYFVDAQEWGVELSCDGCHYTQNGHRTFAKNIGKTIRDLLDEK